MIHTCGQSHFQTNLDISSFSSIEEYDNTEYDTSAITTTSTKLYTSYLGEVTVDVPVNGDIVSLEKYHKIGNKQLLVKVIDSQKHKLNYKQRYQLNKLSSLSAHTIDKSENKYYYLLTLYCLKKFAQINSNNELVVKYNNILSPLLTDIGLVSRANTEYLVLTQEKPSKSLVQYKKLYQKIVRYNSSVDIFFNTTNYLDFLHQSTGIVSVNNLKSIISISNVPDLDNAFFTGEYMVYGNGQKSFYPLTALDVVGHELSHGLVQGTAQLEYKGHSGALNESFSDIMGTCFEFYMYDKYPFILGDKDWLIGEDLGMDRPFLRSMKSPNLGKQPDKYKGEFYLNPNSNVDHGGVHINSGITNYCFYLASQKKDKKEVLTIFIDCLKSLTKDSNLIDFRNTLKSVSKNDSIILKSLDKVGLNNSVTSDYKPKSPQSIPQQPPQQRPQQQPRYPQPRPQRYPQPRPRYPQYPQPRRYPQYPQPRRYPPRYPRRLNVIEEVKSCPFGYTIEDYEEYGDYHEYEEEPFDDYEYYPEY